MGIFGGMGESGEWIATIVAVVLLTALATAGLIGFRIPQPLAAVTALGRAVLQLGLLSLILAGILQDPLLVGIGLAVMFVAAVGTAARRARATGRQLTSVAVAMLLGPLAVMTIVFATGALAFEPRYLLAVGGIVIGNTMTIAVITERTYRSTLTDRWSEVEGWLALGATPRIATADIARSSIHTALLPSIDQTRTTGIVVLPGAFVGAIFGGASPLEAARFQIVVLACILAGGVITASVLTRLTTAAVVRPDQPAKRSTGAADSITS